MSITPKIDSINFYNTFENKKSTRIFPENQDSFGGSEGYNKELTKVVLQSKADGSIINIKLSLMGTIDPSPSLLTDTQSIKNYLKHIIEDNIILLSVQELEELFDRSGLITFGYDYNLSHELVQKIINGFDTSTIVYSGEDQNIIDFLNQAIPNRPHTNKIEFETQNKSKHAPQQSIKDEQYFDNLEGIY